ncbi:hypothetical protein DYB32_006566 [Aphanomyces invadans]|uniref:Uncharacterized protein n=1 Tax=Aphanomyces invadans TaxID=157072 RepID=A0A418ARB6_9STRA|nr:hypothetical protein DYB32_006566 [Aphanomyces invadans]
MWLKDLHELELGLSKEEMKRLAQEESTMKQAGKAKSGKSQAKRKPPAKKRTHLDSDNDSGSDFELTKSKVKKQKDDDEKPKIEKLAVVKPPVAVWKNPVEGPPAQTKVKKISKAPKKELNATASSDKPTKLFKLFEKKPAVSVAAESSEDEEVLSLSERLKRRAMAEKNVESDEDDVFNAPSSAAQIMKTEVLPGVSVKSDDNVFAFAGSLKKAASKAKKTPATDKPKKVAAKPKVAKTATNTTEKPVKPKLAKKAVSVESDKDDTFNFSDAESVPAVKTAASKTKSSKPAASWTSSFFQDSTLGCNAVSWAPFHSAGRQGKRVVTGSCDNSVKVWFLADGAVEWVKEDLAQSTPHHGDWVRDVAWAPSTGAPISMIASASEDRTVAIWTQVNDERWTKEVLHTFEAPVWRVSWSITGNVLAVSSGDHKVTLWKESLDKKWVQISSVDEVGALHQAKE